MPSTTSVTGEVTLRGKVSVEQSAVEIVLMIGRRWAGSRKRYSGLTEQESIGELTIWTGSYS